MQISIGALTEASVDHCRRREVIEGMTMNQEGNTQVQIQAIRDAYPNEQWHKGKKTRGRWFEDWPKKEQSRNSMTAGRLYLEISLALFGRDKGTEKRSGRVNAVDGDQDPGWACVLVGPGAASRRGSSLVRRPGVTVEEVWMTERIVLTWLVLTLFSGISGFGSGLRRRGGRGGRL
ncbi:hypothetical protein B0T10DRAFT_43381 [Thelonectria olida]|uniref:Uncharacterized protein n=1 Tax=Thelonectria olida TaxID=1576542 RepID=A0A9P8W3Y3_9HYPO|nr:hypothetical protein B0T10DRAFT_43381 [Thelonectria olida]